MSCFVLNPDEQCNATGGIINGNAEIWVANEAEFQSPVSYERPFYDVEFDFVFTHKESNKELRIPAFWDGEDTFKVRFALTDLGEWNYKIFCSDESNSLNGEEGTVNCIEYSGEHEIYRRGFLKTQDRYFVYADGTPFFYLGDTHWHMVLEDIEKEEVQEDGRVASRFEYTLLRRKEQGFTVIQSQPLGKVYKGRNSYFVDLFTADFDDAQLSRFQNLDKYFKLIADMGFVHTNSQLGYVSDLGDNMRTMKEGELERLCRYWVARYGAYPVMWTLAQECDNDYYYGSGQFYFTAETNPWKQVAAYIQKYDSYHNPMTAHQENSGSTLASNSAFKDVEGHNWWAAQINYSWYEGTQFSVYKNYWTLGGGKPLVKYETAYDHYWTNTKGARLHGWMAFLNGACGYGYGSQKIWSANESYGVWAGAYTDKTISTGVDTVTKLDQSITWQESLELPASKQLGYMKNYLEERQWWTFTPCFDSYNYFIPAEKLNNHYGAARNQDGDMVIYFYNYGYETGTLNGLSPYSNYRCRWFNPNTGHYKEDFTAISNELGQLEIGQKPDSDDWVFSAEFIKAASPLTIFMKQHKGLFIGLIVLAAGIIATIIAAIIVAANKEKKKRKRHTEDLALKETLRKDMKRLRKTTPAETLLAESASLCNIISELPEYVNAAELYLYAAVNGEVSLETLARKALADGKRIAFPLSQIGSPRMDFYYVDDLQELKQGFMNIPEPVPNSQRLATPSESTPSIMVMPGVAFDKERNRLGYGAGYYDQYLSLHGNKFSQKIGVAYRFQIAKRVPAEEHDQKPDIIVTLDGIIK